MLVISLLFAAMAMAAPTENPTDLRVWTSLTGHQIKAEFIRIEGENAILKYEDGQKHNVRLPMLVQADQVLAQELDKLSKGTAQTKGTSPAILPVFITGDPKSYHAVYSHENFTAKVKEDGSMEIQCMESGEAVGKPIPFNFSCRYTTLNPWRTNRRYITKFEKFPAPTTSPTLLEYEASLDDGAMLGMNYAFVKNTIQIWYWVVDPPQISHPTAMDCSLRFNASHTFPPEKLVSEQKEILKPYTLVVHQKNKAIVRLPYGDAVSQFPESVQQIIIEGPIFGNRSVSVAAEVKKSMNLGLSHYVDHAPYQGYACVFSKVNPASKSDFERIIITIN